MMVYEEEFIERFGFKEEHRDQYRNIFAKEVFSDTLNEYTEIINKLAKNKDDIRSIIVRNTKNGYGDSASWISFEDNSELEALYNQYQRVDSDEKQEVFNQVYNYMDSSPVMTWRDNDGEEDGPRQVIWRGTEEELRNFITDFLENRRQDRKYWMAYPTDIYEIDMSTGNMKEDYVLLINQFSDFWVPDRKTDSAATADNDTENASGFVSKQTFYHEVQIEEKNKKYYSDRIGIDNFKDKNFALTECKYRMEIARFILHNKGIIKDSMSRKVQVLIFNQTITNKHKEALELKQAGWEIQLIRESDFMKEYGIEPIMNDYSKKTTKEVVIETLVNLYDIQGEENPAISKVNFTYYLDIDSITDGMKEVLRSLQDKNIILVSKGIIEVINPDELEKLMLSIKEKESNK